MPVVKNTSKGYNYNYASLADIVAQGQTLPKMRTKRIGSDEYIEYYDAGTEEWLQGAKVVIVDSKSSNAAQNYGAAISYARRYTALMALCLACTDDDAIEFTIDDALAEIKNATTKEELDRIYKEAPEKYRAIIIPACKKRTEELKEKK